RCLQLPLPAMDTVHGDLTIHAAMVLLAQDGSQAAHEALTECALLPLHGSKSGFLRAGEGAELPQGFHEQMARKAAGHVVTILPTDRAPAYAEYILEEYKSAGKYDEDSAHIRELAKSVERERRIAAGDASPDCLPPLERLPGPADQPPPGHISWPYPPGRITLNSVLAHRDVPNLTDPEGYAALYDGVAENPSQPRSYVAIPKETLALYHLVRLAESPEEQALQACERLALDDSLPAPVQRWAYLTRLLLLDRLGRHDELLRLGEAWLASNPDDEIGLAVRWHLARRYAHRSVEELGVPWEDRQAIVDRLIAPIFRQRTPYDSGTIASYFDYAEVTEQIGVRVAGERSRSARAMAQAEDWPEDRRRGERREILQYKLACFQRSRGLLHEAAGVLEQYLANPNLADKWHLCEDKAQKALRLVRREIESLDGGIAAGRSELAEVDGGTPEEQAEGAAESAFDEILDE
ncbi:MAG: hypothetical protein JXR94_00850, partial [Candidatus Hydrogenedentes bacterium]|nr:hypothetical protein [Candidatus Hydrogenedentota bacterium]